jgi:hypothetical protein
VLSKLSKIVALAVITSAAALTGCTTASTHPYALTGDTTSTAQLTAAQRARYSDQKMHFHPEWVGQPGH